MWNENPPQPATESESSRMTTRSRSRNAACDGAQEIPLDPIPVIELGSSSSSSASLSSWGSENEEDEEVILTPIKPITARKYNFKNTPTPYSSNNYFHPNVLSVYAYNLMEIELMNMMAWIIKNKNWIEEVQNPETKLLVWLQEYVNVSGRRLKDSSSSSLMQFAISTCKHEAEKAAACNYSVVISNVPGAYESKPQFRNGFHEELKNCIAELENSFEDWNRDSQVLQLVHPNLYCYVWEVSRDWDNDCTHLNWNQLLGSGQPFTTESKEDHDWESLFSEENCYAWLPSQVSINPTTGKVHIDSYINNLHPLKHAPLYRLLEKILEKSIPLFNTTLTTLLNNWDQGKSFLSLPNTFSMKRNQVPKHFPPSDPKIIVDLKRILKLQVVFKIVTIQLTPENPKYKGGSWHTEGDKCDRVIASAIYYQDFENITSSSLSFRLIAKDKKTNLYKYENLGAVDVHPGKLLVFPNIYQHKVEPFELKDPTRPGFRKIINFCLVNPAEDGPSTARVPPQLASWYFDQICSEVPQINELPSLVNKVIFDYCQWPMTLKQAKKYREGLIEKRKGAPCQDVIDELNKTRNMSGYPMRRNRPQLRTLSGRMD